MAIEQLLEIMSRLRDPESGCLWDIRQTYSTIVPYTLEEAYEVADATQGKTDLHGLTAKQWDAAWESVKNEP